MRPAATTPPPSWADLSPDQLRDVSGRLHDAADFVRFHAVCRPWRDAAQLATRRPTFLPWLLAPCNGLILHSSVNFFRRVSSETSSYRSYGDVVIARPQCAPSSRHRIWVASADGTAAWFLDARLGEPRLLDLLTGAVTPLPRFPDEDHEIRRLMENPRCIVYGDGTVFLYSFSDLRRFLYTPAFTAAILRPGDAAWTVAQKRLDLPASRHSRAAYHDGKIVVSVGVYLWCVLTPNFGANGDADADAGGSRLESRWDGNEEGKYSRHYNYLLESRGELLWASVLVERDWRRRYAGGAMERALSVTVHALEEADGGGETRWLRRDCRSLGDRVLFLGSPASFAMDAAQLGVGGGCAYFVYRCGVFRYSLVDGEANFVERLRPGWDTDDEACVWLRPPQPAIAPIHEIRERFEAPNKKKQKI